MEIRTPVTGVKGPCPRPLDDGDVLMPFYTGGALYIDKIRMSSFDNETLTSEAERTEVSWSNYPRSEATRDNEQIALVSQERSDAG